MGSPTAPQSHLQSRYIAQTKTSQTANGIQITGSKVPYLTLGCNNSHNGIIAWITTANKATAGKIGPPSK